MITVALIGPDGAGKTTVARRLEQTLPWPTHYIYMGVNLDSSNHMLPTTRLVRAVKRFCRAAPDNRGPRAHDDAPRVDGNGPVDGKDPVDGKNPVHGKNPVRRTAKEIKSALGLIHRLSEELFRHLLVSHYRRRGRVVLLDRLYFADYHAYDIADGGSRRNWSRRVHGAVLKRCHRMPELIVYLDAPAEVLLARKGEGTLALLERRRQDYMQLRPLVPHFVVVDAARPEEEVVAEVARHITTGCEARVKATVKSGTTEKRLNGG